MSDKKYIIDNPDIMAEWDWEKNNKLNLNPESLSINSSKKANWICSKGHSWITTINKRTVDNTNCPFCANKKVLKGFNDLESNFPNLIQEWDWKLNNTLNIFPDSVYWGSTKKVNWICSHGHSWVTSIYHRTIRKTNCPYCSNKKILPGYNDLKSQKPELMKEWDFQKNTLNPENIGVFSSKIAHWICPRGHEYQKAIYYRVNGIGCPTCVKAQKTSFPEQVFFFYIKKAFPDAINGYKDIFDNSMELDIYIPSIKVGIEYDGIFWHNNKNTFLREKKKYSICKQNNIKLYRIKEGAGSNFGDIADYIFYIPPKNKGNILNLYVSEFLKRLTFFSPKQPLIDVEKDKNEILEYMSVKYSRSLEYLFPEISKEWHPTKNGKLTPDLFDANSTENAWWQCLDCGHEWRAIIANRTQRGTGCNVCAASIRQITRRNTLLSTRQVLNKEICLLDWDYEKNEYGPEHYTNGSGEIVNWKCHVCGHRWKASICNRAKDYKNGCPLCSGKTIVCGINDLFTLRPDLMNEWYWEGNTNIDPKNIGIGSHIYAQWKCEKCEHVWQSKIYNRANGKGCPKCASKNTALLHRASAISKNGSFEETHPHIAKEWHPTKNGEYKPCMFSKGSDFKAWWICSQCQKEWIAAIGTRCRGHNCPSCSKKKAKKNSV